MEIKKTSDGWEYGGITFDDKASAEGVKAATEAAEASGNSEIPKELQYDPSTPVEEVTDIPSFTVFIYNLMRDSKEYPIIKDVYEAVGVSKATFASWMRGASMPSTTNCEKIKEITGCSAEDLTVALKSNTESLVSFRTGLAVDDVREVLSKKKDPRSGLNEAT